PAYGRNYMVQLPGAQGRINRVLESLDQLTVTAHNAELPVAFDLLFGFFVRQNGMYADLVGVRGVESLHVRTSPELVVRRKIRTKLIQKLAKGNIRPAVLLHTFEDLASLGRELVLVQT